MKPERTRAEKATALVWAMEALHFKKEHLYLEAESKKGYAYNFTTLIGNDIANRIDILNEMYHELFNEETEE